MGGLISLYAVMKYPDVFSRAAIFSPAFWVNPQYLDLAGTSTFRPDVKLYFLIGAIEAVNAEEAASYVKHQKDVVDVLLSRGLRSDTNVVSIVRADGKHSEWFWRREFPAAYNWLFPR